MARAAWLPALVFLVGAVASFLLYSVERNNRRLLVENEFAQAANTRASAIRRAFEHGVDTTESIVALFAASEEVTRDEFHNFAQPLLKGHAAVQGVSWAPVVPHSKRAEVEQRAGESIPGFRFTKRETQGRMVAAPEAEVYVPVLFLEPLAGNETAAGFDLLSNVDRRQALETARDTGAVATTGRVRLVQETENQYAFLLIAPIYRNGAAVTTVQDRQANLIGFATVVYRAGDLITNSMELLGPVGIDLAVFDESAPPEDRLLHFAPAAIGDGGPSELVPFEGRPANGLEQRVEFEFGGRRWAVVMRPAAGFFGSAPGTLG